MSDGRFWPMARSRVRPGIQLFIVVAVVATFLFATPSRGAAVEFKQPWFTVVVEEGVVFGGDWMSYTTVTITVTDPATNHVDQFSEVAGGTGWFSTEGHGVIDVEPGYVVTVTQGTPPSGYMKVHTVTGVSDQWISPASEEVMGTAAVGDTVEVWFDGDTATKVSDKADAYGMWYVTFAGTGNDLVPGTLLDIREVDDDGDGTLINRVAPADSDQDGIDDNVDNCPMWANATQYDGDGDGVGSVCDDVDRLWGPNRYGTAAAVSQTTFEWAGTVFIALGTNFPDALVAAAAGGFMGAPVLLTGKTSLPLESLGEISRLQPDTAYIVGGTAVIGSAVEQQIRALVPTVKRLSGSNRYETSAAVSQEVFSGAEDVFIALGTNFPDALVAAAAGGHLAAPVLLTTRDHVPQATIDEVKRLNPHQIYIVGGTAAISDTVSKELAPYGNVKRLAGANRYETAAAVAEEAFLGTCEVLLAYGGNFPDALVAAAAGGYLSGPVLLVTHDGIPASTRKGLDRFKPCRVRVIGGTAVIGDSVFNALP